MDLEALQLLNLSPIPELSELELSTMLDHLSGLSDVNGDLTDRNVEDILKEAEDLLDKSINSETNQPRDVSNSQTVEENQMLCRQDETISDDNKDQDFHDLDFSNSKHCNTPVHSDHTVPENFPNEDETKQTLSSSFEHTPTKIHSPGSSSNHIKSTIDSLKEFSTIIEKKLGNQSPKSSSSLSKEVKQSPTQDKKVTRLDDELKETISIKPMCKNSKIEKLNLPAKKNMPDSVTKSIKLLNCFERLYQDRPIRAMTKNKPNVSEKLPKATVKKKLSKGLKSKKSIWSEKKVPEHNSTKISSSFSYSELQTDLNEEHILEPNRKSLKQCYSNNDDRLLQMKVIKNEANGDCDFPNHDLKIIQSDIDEKVTQKVLEGADKTKVEKGKTKVIRSDGLNLNLLSEIHKPISSAESEEEEKITSTSENNFGIRRLEEQFSSLKEKYENQMAKLEAENFRLKEALSSQQNGTPMMSSNAENLIIRKNSKIFSPPSSCDQNAVQSASLENCKVPKNSPCSSVEDVQTLTTVKEAFSQTEKDLKSRSIQCCQEFKETGTNAETISEPKRVENKENVSSKKKLTKTKPFSDVNVHRMLKQKKTFDHESQLLATLRGLQSEVNLKDKENRKLKIEIDSLRKQTKKSTGCKTENCKKCHIGTQTIGLMSLSQRPYNPENYEVPQEFDKVNEELRTRIRALEEDFERLKEKRINDLQSLHQVHEEEMAKLVSKLETQSALTKHLHSLLINR